MQKLLSQGLWESIRAQSRKAKQRKAAIAYVTQDLIGLRKGDTLIVDASPQAISSGETSASVLSHLERKKVRLFNCPGLHAKVLLLDDVAIIGSGNMSNSSRTALVEAALMTDHASTVAGAASFIEQLTQQSQPILPEDIDRLSAIKVIRRGGRPWLLRNRRRAQVRELGTRTWLIGVRELAREPAPNEQKMIARAAKKLRAHFSSADDLEWLRWAGKGRFVRECREGDIIIRIWRTSRSKRPRVVLPGVPVLLVQRTKTWTRFYVADGGSRAEMHWGKFKRLCSNSVIHAA